MTAIAIRPFDLSDAPQLIGWFPTPREVALWGSPARRFPLDQKQIAAFLAETHGEKPMRRIFAQVAEGILLATATTILDWEQGVARLAMVGLAPASRGRGLAAPFLAQVIATVFAEPEFERIDLNVYTSNTAALRTYEKLGFAREGVMRSLAKVGSERWDTAHYAMLRSEYAARASDLRG